MKSYETEGIRNVGIVGHGDTGKTKLVSSLLFTAGMTQRLGKVAEGTAPTDWDEEEIARKISIQTGIAYAEWAPTGQTEKRKINFLDTPGYSTFINDTKASLIAADASLIVVDALAGVQVVTEKVWDYATEYEQPRAIEFRADHQVAAGSVWPRSDPYSIADWLAEELSRRDRSGQHEGADLHAR